MKNSTDFAGIETFVRVAEAGSFRVAAQRLGAPASTISVRVSRLEERLGTKLFARTTRRVALTDEGRLYFERVRSALETVGEAERLIASRSSKARGRLAIAAPVDFGQAVLGQIIGRYAKKHPDVDVELTLTSASVDLLRDGYDVALMTDPPESTSLVARKVGVALVHRLFASPSYLTRAGQPTHLRDLAKHTCLVMGTRSAPAAWRFLKGGAPHVFARRHVIANSWPVLYDLAVAGRGIALLPAYLGMPAVASGALCTVLDAYGAPAQQMYAVYAQSAFVPLRVSAFVTEVKAFLERWPGCVAAQGAPR